LGKGMVKGSETGKKKRGKKAQNSVKKRDKRRR